MNRGALNTESGRAFVEAALTIPVVFLIVFSGIQFMIMAWHTVTTQYVVSKAVQRAAVGMCTGPLASASPYITPVESQVCPAADATAPTVTGDQQKRAKYAYLYAIGLAKVLGVNLNDYNASTNRLGLMNPTVCVATFDSAFATSTCAVNNKKLLGAPDGKIIAMVMYGETGFSGFVPKPFRLKHTVSGFAMALVN